MRYSGKEKLSSKRFQCYVEAAKLALQQLPRNPVVGVEQKIKPTQNSRYGLTAEQAKVHAKMRQVAAGRGGSRGGGCGYRRGNPEQRQGNASRWRRNNRPRPGFYVTKLASSRKRMRSPDSVDDQTQKGANNDGYSTADKEMDLTDQTTENLTEQDQGQWSQNEGE